MSRAVSFVWLEGHLEEPVARRLLADAGLDLSTTKFKVAGGGTKFWPEVKRYNEAARHDLLFVALADLEQEPCPAAVFSRHLPRRTNSFILRLAVKMLESWLLADGERMAAFLHAPQSRIPQQPDQEEHPKRLLVELARKHAPSALKRDLVPERGLSGVVGPGYRPQMELFINNRWRPQIARHQSPSLDRALAALERAARG
jgi:hypothetical protein